MSKDRLSGSPLYELEFPESVDLVGAYYAALGWVRYEAKVSKERGKYILWFSSPSSIAELMLKGEYLDLDTRLPVIKPRLRRVL